MLGMITSVEHESDRKPGAVRVCDRESHGPTGSSHLERVSLLVPADPSIQFEPDERDKPPHVGLKRAERLLDRETGGKSSEAKTSPTHHQRWTIPKKGGW